MIAPGKALYGVANSSSNNLTSSERGTNGWTGVGSQGHYTDFTIAPVELVDLNMENNCG